MEDSKFHGRCRYTVLGEKATGEHIITATWCFGEAEETGLHGAPLRHFGKSQKAVDVGSKSEEKRKRYLYRQRTGSGRDAKPSEQYARLMCFSYLFLVRIQGLCILMHRTASGLAKSYETVRQFLFRFCRAPCTISNQGIPHRVLDWGF